MGSKWRKRLSVIHMQIALCRVWKFISIRLNTLVLLCVAAMVFLRAKYAGVAVFHLILWKPEISFNIDFGLMSLGTKNFHYLVENRYVNLDGLNHSHIRPTLARFSVTFMWESVDFTKKGVFQLYIFFQVLKKVIVIGLLTFFHVEKSVYRNIEWFLRYIQKCMKKNSKKRLHKKRYNFNTSKDF